MADFGKYGTSSTVMQNNSVGGLPTRNWSAGYFETAEQIDGITLYDTILKERDTCYSCSVRCKRVVEAEYQGNGILPVYGGAEYENLATLGSYCGIDDLRAVSTYPALQRLRRHTIAAGATITSRWTASSAAYQQADTGMRCASATPRRWWRCQQIVNRAGFGVCWPKPTAAQRSGVAPGAHAVRRRAAGTYAARQAQPGPDLPLTRRRPQSGTSGRAAAVRQPNLAAGRDRLTKP
jgi:hypothetical protein